jgi:peptidoglycan hydrolase CwlO-like protein
LFAEEVKNLFKKEEEKEVVNENLNKDVIMENLEKFQNILGLEAESSVEDVIAAIEGLKSGQAEAEGKIEALNAKVTEKEADVEEKDGEIAELKATVAELTAKIPATPLDNKGDDFEGKENLGDIPLFG